MSSALDISFPVSLFFTSPATLFPKLLVFSLQGKVKIVKICPKREILRDIDFKKPFFRVSGLFWRAYTERLLNCPRSFSVPEPRVLLFLFNRLQASLLTADESGSSMRNKQQTCCLCNHLVSYFLFFLLFFFLLCNHPLMWICFNFFLFMQLFVCGEINK